MRSAPMNLSEVRPPEVGDDPIIPDHDILPKFDDIWPSSQTEIMPTMNVSVTPEQSRLIAMEVESGHYTSASEVVREALRVWREKQIEKDLAALERAHAGAHERDITPEELKMILEAQREARAQLRKKRR